MSDNSAVYRQKDHGEHPSDFFLDGLRGVALLQRNSFRFCAAVRYRRKA
jgi:hypothetical protein